MTDIERDEIEGGFKKDIAMQESSLRREDKEKLCIIYSDIWKGD